MFIPDSNGYAKQRLAHHKAAAQQHTEVLDFLLAKNENLIPLTDAEGNNCVQILQAARRIPDRTSWQVATKSSTKCMEPAKQIRDEQIGFKCLVCSTFQMVAAKRTCCGQVICTACSQLPCKECLSTEQL